MDKQPDKIQLSKLKPPRPLPRPGRIKAELAGSVSQVSSKPAERITHASPVETTSPTTSSPSPSPAETPEDRDTVSPEEPHPAAKNVTAAQPAGATDNATTQGTGDSHDVTDDSETSCVETARVHVESRAAATRRWIVEGRAAEVEAFRETARTEYRKAHPKGTRQEARDFAWEAALKAFPPPSPSPVEPRSGGHFGLPKLANPDAETTSEFPETQNSGSGRDSGRVQGLGEIPADWPELPANSSLANEIGWVQANRLYVVEEKPSGATVVHLERAHEPAPSRAALGWLETSIRSYAKFVDVVAKSLASGSDDKEQVRRERMKIEDVRRLLDEMHRDQ